MAAKRSGLQERLARRRGAVLGAEMERAANVFVSLDEIAARHRRALIAGKSDRARKVARLAHDAGLTVVMPYTDDLVKRTRVAGVDQAVRIGEKHLPGMEDNCHSVFLAASSAGADVVLFSSNSPLLSDDEFLGLCAAGEIEVFSPVNADDPAASWVGHEVAVPIDDTDWEWITCPSCGLTHSALRVAINHYVCPNCGRYLRIDSDKRIDEVLDHASFEEWNAELPEANPLEFPGYEAKLARQRKKSGKAEAVRCGKGTITGIPCAFAVMDSTFFMASMGHVVGEKLTRLVERATAEKLPVIIFCASGGARMQEGLVSLMQMAKVSAALERHSAAGLLYVSVITDPTTGGVTASFATEGDIILAEPGALIGFAGRRVIQDTIKQELPDDFQTAEFALEHGLIDAIVPRDQMRACLANILAIHLAGAVEARAAKVEREEVLADDPAVASALAAASEEDSRRGILARALPRVRTLISHRMPKSLQPALPKPDSERSREEIREERRYAQQVARDEAAAAKRAARREYALAKADGKDALRAFRASQEALRQESRAARDRVRKAEQGSAWQSVQIARNVHRPTAQYYINALIDGFFELHGDRAFGDDGAIICGLGWFGDKPVTVVVEEKGLDLKERIRRNFGCPQPEGYRKSLRVMAQAEKFGRPIVAIVDTQGAFCGVSAEERGQGNAIAENLRFMAGLTVPVVVVLIGEGGSGGALALAVGNKVAMLEHAVYSVLSPEGFASILWKDGSRAPEAAELMRMTGKDVFSMGLIDAVLDEGPEGAHETPERAAASVRGFIEKSLSELSGLTRDELRQQRYDRFRRM